MFFMVLSIPSCLVADPADAKPRDEEGLILGLVAATKKEKHAQHEPRLPEASLHPPDGPAHGAGPAQGSPQTCTSRGRPQAKPAEPVFQLCATPGSRVEVVRMPARFDAATSFVMEPP